MIADDGPSLNHVGHEDGFGAERHDLGAVAARVQAPRVRRSAPSSMSVSGARAARRPERQNYRDTGHELQPGDGPGVGPPIECFLVQDVEEGAQPSIQQAERERH